MPAFSLHKKFSILYVYTKTPENPEILKRKELKKMEKDNGQWITLQPDVQFYMQVQEKKEDIAFNEWCKSRK